MEMLLRHGVRMRAMRGDDWDFLVSLCDDDVRAWYAEAREEETVVRSYHEGLKTYVEGHVHDQLPFMQHCAHLRGKMDRYVNAYLNHDSRAAYGPSLAMGRWGDRMKPVVATLEAQILGLGDANPAADVRAFDVKALSRGQDDPEAAALARERPSNRPRPDPGAVAALQAAAPAAGAAPGVAAPAGAEEPKT